MSSASPSSGSSKGVPEHTYFQDKSGFPELLVSEPPA
jgi:hypothetical protein